MQTRLNLLINIGLLSCLPSPVSRVKVSSQLEVPEYKYWKSLKGFTISVNTISLEGLDKTNNKIELNSSGNGVKVELQSVSGGKNIANQNYSDCFFILPAREES